MVALSGNAHDSTAVEASTVSPEASSLMLTPDSISARAALVTGDVPQAGERACSGATTGDRQERRTKRKKEHGRLCVKQEEQEMNRSYTRADAEAGLAEHDFGGESENSGPVRRRMNQTRR